VNLYFIMRYGHDSNDDNDHGHHHHRWDNDGNYAVTIGTVPFLDILPTSSAASACCQYQVELLLLTLLLKLLLLKLLSRYPFNSSICYYSPNTNYCVDCSYQSQRPCCTSAATAPAIVFADHSSARLRDDWYT
jgi:hypothetical protein